MRTRIHASLRTAIALLAIPFLTAVAAASGLKWEKTETSLALRDGERVVWRFSAGPESGKPYFHPVCLPDGTVATDYRPADHKWHLGLWFTFNKVNGINFWGEDEKGVIGGPGRVKVEQVKFETRDDFSATISLDLAYCKGEERLLAERRKYEIAAPGKHANSITAQHEFTAVADVVIDRSDYGGCTFRPAPELRGWRWEVAPPFPGQRSFDFPERFPEKYNRWLVLPPAKWMALVDKPGPGGETRGVGILDHPKNPRYPTCWGGVAYNANVWLADEMRLAKGEKLALRYRVLFFDRQTTVSFMEEQHALFVKQPE